jgi:hypothetical protein
MAVNYRICCQVKNADFFFFVVRVYVYIPLDAFQTSVENHFAPASMSTVSSNQGSGITLSL